MFEKPVTEDIAPGYFKVIIEPMDYITVEKKLDEQFYSQTNDVSSNIIVGIHNAQPNTANKLVDSKIVPLYD